MKNRKTGGRKAGTPNKITHEYRQLLADILVGELEALPETLASLEPHQRIDATLKIMKYILPPIEAVSVYDIDKAMLNPEGHKECLNSEIETEKFYKRMQLPKKI